MNTEKEIEQKIEELQKKKHEMVLLQKYEQATAYQEQIIELKNKLEELKKA